MILLFINTSIDLVNLFMLTSLNRIPSRAPKSTTPDRHPLRSKTIDRHRLVAVDKKYALMSSDAQYQVSGQLEGRSGSM